MKLDSSILPNLFQIIHDMIKLVDLVMMKQIKVKYLTKNLNHSRNVENFGEIQLISLISDVH